ncbi:MAG: hypothetical protein N2201_03040, partial [candidate division WOR-3 bacterium]|nr:hypothetical protein [candidate division WOR-3 bacterium]
ACPLACRPAYLLGDRECQLSLWLKRNFNWVGYSDCLSKKQRDRTFKNGRKRISLSLIYQNFRKH